MLHPEQISIVLCSHLFRDMLLSVIVSLFIIVHVTICLGEKSANSCQSWQRPFPVDEMLFPFDSKCILLTHGRIHYIDLQPAGIEPLGTVLAFHGNPVWSIIFTRVAKLALEKGFRFLALDYYGYGMSDKPDATTFDYTVRAQARAAAEFMRQLNLTDLLILVSRWRWSHWLRCSTRRSVACPRLHHCQ